ncbi:MAG: hypothetical protein K6F37_01085 [Lachnospiraceae bacterium]|nr:hypothetical protein [Lachnospiraceae bacterium]
MDYKSVLSKLLGLKDSVMNSFDMPKIEAAKLEDIRNTLENDLDAVEKLKAKVSRLEGYAEASRKNNKLLIFVVCVIAIIPVIIACAFYFGKRTAEERAADFERLNEGREMLKLKRQEHFAKIKSRHQSDGEGKEEEIFED